MCRSSNALTDSQATSTLPAGIPHRHTQALHVLIATHRLAHKSESQVHLTHKSPVHWHTARRLRPSSRPSPSCASTGSQVASTPPRSGCVPRTPLSHPSPSCVDRQTCRLTHKSPVHHLTQAASLVAPKPVMRIGCVPRRTQACHAWITKHVDWLASHQYTPSRRLRPSSHPSPSCADRHASTGSQVCKSESQVHRGVMASWTSRQRLG
jgi:hypothetical protein